jgi:hypothetical protein
MTTRKLQNLPSTCCRRPTPLQGINKNGKYLKTLNNLAPLSSLINGVSDGIPPLMSGQCLVRNALLASAAVLLNEPVLLLPSV